MWYDGMWQSPSQNLTFTFSPEIEDTHKGEEDDKGEEYVTLWRYAINLTYKWDVAKPVRKSNIHIFFASVLFESRKKLSLFT